MHAVATVGERGALTGIERVGSDGVGRVEFSHGRRTGRCRDIGALVATGILVQEPSNAELSQVELTKAHPCVALIAAQ